VLHGTNTLEETAYFLHLVLRTTQAVVVTGAMRPLSAASSDAELNLINAVAAASAPHARKMGVLVVLNDAIYSARDITKTSTYRVQSFAGRELGPLGMVDADRRILFYHAPARLHTSATEFNLDGLADLPRVDVTVSYVGADGAMIDAAAAAGARGIVSAAMGAGRPTPLEDAALDRAREKGLAVCIASRVGSGRVVRSPRLEARGFVAADNLPPWKARILLSLALTRTNDPDEIQRLFDTY
jgi:L-asparaginase